MPLGAPSTPCRSTRSTPRRRPQPRWRRSSTPTAGTLTAALAKATSSGSKAPIPVITYREADFAPRQGAAPGARRCHHPDVGAAARQDADLRSAAARHLRRGDGRDDRGRRRALRRRGPGRPQRPPGAVRLPARRSHGLTVTIEWRHVALRPGADERHRRAHDAGPSGAGGGRDLAGRRRAGRPRRTGCRRRADRRGPGRCERPDERLRPCHHRPVPTGIDLQGRDDVRLPHPRHHDADLTGAVPANGHGRRARVPQLRGRVDRRDADVLPGLHRVVQHRVRRALRPARRGRPRQCCPRARHRGRLGRRARGRRGLRGQRPEHEWWDGCRRRVHRPGPHRGIARCPWR